VDINIDIDPQNPCMDINRQTTMQTKVWENLLGNLEDLHDFPRTSLCKEADVHGGVVVVAV